VKYRIKVFDREFEVEIEEIERDLFEVVVNGKRAVLRVTKTDINS